ncbi:hypothetical protein LWI29_025361 [Acer saccharum]|uniref:non-specific serine/threonine protein kinase n=1 Tax=Acer saccharum TaxID=4024 RepID=A0AA39S6Q5_ACESA|nr:hypothetical protein LWI29_008812 [Acer saccharum]KAK0585242.1 hypothetical protein LWI29_025361 [Acer saccharum]
MEGSNRGRSGVDGFLQNYKVGRTLGIGSFGKVKIAEHLFSGLKVAIKVLNRSKITEKGMEDKVRREIQILRLFKHPHITRLYEVIETPTYIYYVMEYMESGELFDYIVERGRIQEAEARKFFQQLIAGLEYCHRNMVVHRDLKPENLLLDSKCNLKIADFGLSNVMRDGHFLKTNCGSANYAAPEVISEKLYAGPEVDVWSCGVILYALLCGRLPFDDESLPILFKKIKGGTYALPSNLPAGASDLITRMLIVDPMKRITIPKIRQHPWFQAHLPRYLAPHTRQQPIKIDEDILKESVKMGFDQNQLVESLCNDIQNEATVTYYLLLDNRYRAASSDDHQETMESGFSYMHPSEVNNAPIVRHSFPAQSATKRKWALGLQSRAHPHQIMTQVLKALQELNVCWKKIGHYNIKCRCIPDHHLYSGDESTINKNDDVIKPPNVVKFEVQLYKAHEDKYLLDLQRVQGPQCLFLDLCAAFLVQLGVL